jgi:hypothetical protein
MLSPFKFCPFEDNSFLIGSNQDLATRLQQLFNTDAGKHLWTLNTIRQKTTHALRHTEAIMLRKLKVNSTLANTLEYNQVMEVEDTAILSSVKLFQETVAWLETALQAQGVTNIEWGRIFFSKHHAGTDIDTHIDEGAYFSHFDRFHFCVNSNENNVFHIRDQDCKLEEGSLYWVNNHVPHWLKNQNTTDRINLIFDARLI